MRRVERLKREALKAARFRGHTMRRFKAGWSGDKYYTSECKVCDKQAAVIPNPGPNEIDVGGEAVALGCED